MALVFINLNTLVSCSQNRLLTLSAAFLLLQNKVPGAHQQSLTALMGGVLIFIKGGGLL